MRHLLEFLYEHSLDKLFYCVLPAAGGECELTWRAAAPLRWEVRLASAEAAEIVPRSSLLSHLHESGADLLLFERELSTLVAAHIVLADQMLTAARGALGSEAAHSALQGQESFVRELRQALTGVLSPRLTLVR